MSSALSCADEDVAQEPTATSEVTTTCTLVRSGAAWWNSAFPTESGSFHVEFTATASANNINAVIGISNGAAGDWAKLAAIVRFSPDGIIDVRRGNAYSYSSRTTYSARQPFRFRIDVNVKAHTYSVYILNPDQNPVTLAKDFAFRTEQAGVTSLNNLASYVEPSRAGSLNVCGVRVVHDDSFANDCIASNAGGPFQNIQIESAPNVLLARFQATPSASPMDGVVGFGMGTITDYNKFAVTLRFATTGKIEARDGDTYRADRPYAYRAGTLYRFELIVDLATKTYSLRVAQDPSFQFVEIARSYKFRPRQAAITALDHGATVVASTTGRIDACGLRNQTWPGLKFAHRGYASVLPLYNNNLAFTDATGTLITNANGVPLYRGAPSGLVAHDNNDNLFIVSKQNGYLVLSSYTATLSPRWTRQYVIDGEPDAINAWTDGTIAVSVGKQRLYEYRPDGTESGSINLAQFSPAAVAIGHSSWGIVQIAPDGMTVTNYTTTGQFIFQRFFSGTFSPELLVPRGQGLVMTGQFNSTVNFGNGPWQPQSNSDTTRNTFLLSLTANGVVARADRLYTTNSTGLATDDNIHIAVAAQDWTQSPWWNFSVFDSAGTGFGFGGTGGASDAFGFAGAISVSGNGRAFVNLGPTWYPGAVSDPWEYVFAFDKP